MCLLQNMVSSFAQCFSFYIPAEPAWQIRAPASTTAVVQAKPHLHFAHTVQARGGYFWRKTTSVKVEDPESQQPEEMNAWLASTPPANAHGLTGRRENMATSPQERALGRAVQRQRPNAAQGQQEVITASRIPGEQGVAPQSWLRAGSGLPHAAARFPNNRFLFSPGETEEMGAAGTCNPPAQSPGITRHKGQQGPTARGRVTQAGTAALGLWLTITHARRNLERDPHPAPLIALVISTALSTKKSFDNESDPGLKWQRKTYLSVWCSNDFNVM